MSSALHPLALTRGAVDAALAPSAVDPPLQNSAFLHDVYVLHSGCFGAAVQITETVLRVVAVGTRRCAYSVGNGKEKHTVLGVGVGATATPPVTAGADQTPPTHGAIGIPFCPCAAFRFRVVRGEEYTLCKHLLAVLLATTEEAFRVRSAVAALAAALPTAAGPSTGGGGGFDGPFEARRLRFDDDDEEGTQAPGRVAAVAVAQVPPPPPPTEEELQRLHAAVAAATIRTVEVTDADFDHMLLHALFASDGREW